MVWLWSLYLSIIRLTFSILLRNSNVLYIWELVLTLSSYAVILRNLIDEPYKPVCSKLMNSFASFTENERPSFVLLVHFLRHPQHTWVFFLHDLLRSISSNQAFSPKAVLEIGRLHVPTNQSCQRFLAMGRWFYK